MKRKIEIAITDLNALKSNDIYSASKISWWLLKYDDLHKYCEDNWNKDSCHRDLPCSHTLNSIENKFQDFYCSLNELVYFQKFEEKCKKELQLFKEDDKQIWVKKNEELASLLFTNFWLEIEVESNHIKFSTRQFKLGKIKLPRDDFRYIFEFLRASLLID